MILYTHISLHYGIVEEDFGEMISAVSSVVSDDDDGEMISAESSVVSEERRA